MRRLIFFTLDLASGEQRQVPFAEANYSRKKCISIYGASAGGYLVGATTNMRPDLYAATIAAVPFVDVLNSELDIELPPTYRSWAEWGNPLHNKADFENLQRISPYDNVQSQAYPYMFLTGGLADFRVPFWEPAKFAARIRAHNTGDSKILLKMAGAGHSAASSGVCWTIWRRRWRFCCGWIGN